MNFDVHVFWQYLFDPNIVQGAEITIILAVLSQALGIILGLFTALARLSRSPVPIFRLMVDAGVSAGRAIAALYFALSRGRRLDLPWLRRSGARLSEFGPISFLLDLKLPPIHRWIAGVYIWLFRGTPLLVQLAFVYFAIPQMTGNNIVIPEFQSAVIALSLNEGAYMAEIVRAGITSVDSGQVEAANSLGMSGWLAMRRIVLPQAIRFIIPPTGNEFISMLKNTSLAYYISTKEIFFQDTQIASATFQYFELLSVVSVWYLAMTTVATIIQSRLERRFERGFSRDVRGPGLMQRAMVGALRRG